MSKKIMRFKKEIACVLIVMFTYITTSVCTAPYTSAVKTIAYYYGSKGDVVITIQTRLRDWGYYSGSIDGVYGYQTFAAVKKFQAYNGLNVDGVAGNDTLNAIGINVAGLQTAASGGATTNNQDLMLLARLINGEARGEPYEGQVAVGSVVLNRTRDPRFPSTIAGVIYQPGAFTAVVDGQINASLYQTSITAAQDALNGWDPSSGAIYYFNPSTATSSWIWSRPLIKIIGKHRFCR